ncbi:MAG: SGNH/GDSL hydrolase family protein [Phycisphaerales bacterium]|nr:SGNH/GDSL hydrolase family protein [Phycisphaerales bacterium]
MPRITRIIGCFGGLATLLYAFLAIEMLTTLRTQRMYVWVVLVAAGILLGVHVGGCVLAANRRAWQKLAIMLGTFWMTAVIGEAFAHIYATTQADLRTGPDIAMESWRMIPHPYLAYVPTPGWLSDDGKCRHNSVGIRGEEISEERPRGVRRILLLGGSTTYGEGVQDNTETWSKFLDSILDERHPDVPTQVVNMGVPGYYSTESLINLILRGINLDPEIAVFYHGCNDAHTRFLDPENYRSDGTGYRRVWNRDSKDTLASGSLGLRFSGILRFVAVRCGGYIYSSKLLGLESFTLQPERYSHLRFDEIRGQAFDRSKLIDLNRPVYFERNLRLFVAVCRSSGIEPVLATWAYASFFDDYMACKSYRQAVKEQNEIVRSIAAELSVPLIDLARAGFDQKPSFWVENRHMTATGNLAKAEATYKTLLDAGLLRRGRE